MSIDVQSAIDYSTYFIALAILLLAAYRGVEIGRSFTSRVYRSRAFWIAGLCIADFVQSLVPDSWMIDKQPVFEVTFFALVFVVFIFIDSTILVTLEMDFFHRNTLRWRQVRFVAYAVFIGFGAIWLFTAQAVRPLAIVSLALYGYSAVALIIGALRTPDRTLRRHILLLGLVLVISVVTTFTFNYTSTLWVDLLDDFLDVLTSYFLYRAVMLLSPVGRVAKEIV